MVIMKPSLKFLDTAIEDLREQLQLFRRDIEAVRDEIREIRSDLRACDLKVSENAETGETLKCSLTRLDKSCTSAMLGHTQLSENQSKLVDALEEQCQYTRKFTLLLSGRVIPSPERDEDTRQVAISLMRDYLGVTVRPGELTACHRLQSKRVILVRFAYLDQRMFVYSRRVRPERHGLLVHESLTPQRLAVVKILQKLHRPKESSPFVSYYTNSGRIFVRLPGSSGATEIPVHSSKEDILTICGGHGGAAGMVETVPKRVVSSGPGPVCAGDAGSSTGESLRASRPARVRAPLGDPSLVGRSQAQQVGPGDPTDGASARPDDVGQHTIPQHIIDSDDRAELDPSVRHVLGAPGETSSPSLLLDCGLAGTVADCVTVPPIGATVDALPGDASDGSGLGAGVGDRPGLSAGAVAPGEAAHGTLSRSMPGVTPLLLPRPQESIVSQFSSPPPGFVPSAGAAFTRPASPMSTTGQTDLV